MAAVVWTGLAIVVTFAGLFVLRRSDVNVPGGELISRSMILVALVFSAYLLKISVFGLTGVWTGLILIISLIAVAGFIRVPIMFEPLMNILGKFSTSTKPKEIDDKYVKSEIKTSMMKFENIKKELNEMKSRKIGQNDKKSIKAAIEMVQSIEQSFKSMKSEKINEADERNIQNAMNKATVAAQAIEKIINNWLSNHA